MYWRERGGAVEGGAAAGRVVVVPLPSVTLKSRCKEDAKELHRSDFAALVDVSQLSHLTRSEMPHP